jgi:hypothetical protein
MRICGTEKRVDVHSGLIWDGGVSETLIRAIVVGAPGNRTEDCWDASGAWVRVVGFDGVEEAGERALGEFEVRPATILRVADRHHVANS